MARPADDSPLVRRLRAAFEGTALGSTAFGGMAFGGTAFGGTAFGGTGSSSSPTHPVPPPSPQAAASGVPAAAQDGAPTSGGIGPLPPRSSAVLATIVDVPGRPCFLFERRPQGPSPWAGQLSFPGGRIEPNDLTPLDAALREAEEEVGFPREAVAVAGHLLDLDNHIGQRVLSYVGVVAPEDVPIRPASPGEVEEIVLVPLDVLRDLGRELGRTPGAMPGQADTGAAEAPEGPGQALADAAEDGTLVPYNVLRHEARTVRPRAGRTGPPEGVLDYWHLEHPHGRRAVLWGLTGHFVAEFLARLEGWQRPGTPRVVDGWHELEP